MFRNSDRQYHRNKHRAHAVINWMHVLIGALFVAALLICLCGGA